MTTTTKTTIKAQVEVFDVSIGHSFHDVQCALPVFNGTLNANYIIYSVWASVITEQKKDYAFNLHSAFYL